MAGRVKVAVAACLRVFVMGLDALFALIGLLTVLLATVCYAHPFLHEFSNALNRVVSVNMLFIGTMVTGVVFIGVGGLGCYGAYRRNSYYLGVHIGIILIMYLFQAAIVYAFGREWEEKLSLGVSFGVMDYDPDKPHRRYMDGIQRVLDCCGGDTPRDYRFNSHFSKKRVPRSCCNIHYEPTRHACSLVSGEQLPIELAYQMGCMDRLYSLLLPSILGVIGGLGGLGLCCTVFPSLYIYVEHLIAREEEEAASEDEDEDDDAGVADGGERKQDAVPLMAAPAGDPEAPASGRRGIDVAVQANRGTEAALEQLALLARSLAQEGTPTSTRHSVGGCSRVCL